MESGLNQYIQVLRKRIWLILITVFVVTLMSGIISYFFIDKQYAASTKLVVNKSSSYQGYDILDYNAVNTNIMLVNTYKEIIKTPAIMEKVASRFTGEGLNADMLAGMTKVTSIADTQVMTITATAADYATAAKLANAVSDVFKAEISGIMKVDNVTILNEAKATDNVGPVTPNVKLNVAAAFIVALLLAVGLVFLIEHLDDTIKTEKDVEKFLGAPTLAVISKIKTADLKNNAPSEPHKKMAGETAYAGVNQ
ncbi:YveK family protein [Paenibacillus sp. UNC499MF]|uniref:YveK family protein n=1 Tax=Paenibacillus sp. UNC499MF TaxID=1502751 RepID=UPI00089FB867|nr:Wzz/FepE/Etk N-terminal domain-containing protein [Paenibacillus sp. UNC499MF]SEF80752.1 Capsular polysaccharide biosynthesis protein [Paenibacillus sp. UNC499MF]